MPASVNTRDSRACGGSRRYVGALAVGFAFLIVLLGLALQPGPVNALGAAAARLDDPPTPTLQPGTGAVAGQAWIDTDADGVLDAGEAGLAGMTVAARSNETGATVSGTSAADGKYRLAGLTPGLYRITATAPQPYQLTSQDVYDVVVSAGVTLMLNFGAVTLPTVTPSPTPPPILDLDGAESLTCGGVYTGHTQSGKNNVSTYACRPWWDESGKERVYRLELTARQPITVTLLQASADLDLFLLRYALPDSCLAAGDNYLTYSADVGPYILSIDGYQGASGSYTFRLDCPAEVQATATPTFTPSPTPTNTATFTPAPSLTPTPSQSPRRAYLPMVLAASTAPTPLPVTFILQDGLNGYTGTTDTTLSSWEPNTAQGADKVLRLFYARNSTITSQMEPAIRFDLSLLPRNATVDKATLQLYVPATPLYDVRARVAGLLRAWDESTATWQLAAADQPWTLPGASAIGSDRSAWVSATQQIVEGSRWYEFDLTPLVREWAAYPERNQGVVVTALAGDSNANVEARFVSREGTPAWRPQLIISYTLTTVMAAQ